MNNYQINLNKQAAKNKLIKMNPKGIIMIAVSNKFKK